MQFQGSDILTTKQFDREAVTIVFDLAKHFEKVLRGQEFLDLARGKILANLFYEPSTRTRFSFEVAMKKLGGDVITAVGEEYSSLRKGETLYDTGRVISQFAHVIAMRHAQPGSVSDLAQGATVPVLNAGDGPANHPTQGLLDLYTIWKQRGEIDGLRICMAGDLKNSRVQHSECDLLMHYRDVKFVFVSPQSLKMPTEIVANLRLKGFEISEMSNLSEAVSECDVISSSRIQIERFASMEEYNRNTGIFVIDPGVMAHVKKDAILLAPLPRIEEITREVDDDLRAKYFEQVKNGVPVRMALLALVLALKI